MAEKESDLQIALNRLNVATGRMDHRINKMSPKLRHQSAVTSVLTLEVYLQGTSSCISGSEGNVN
uniref:Uncharacterized protein n=1 Tax=Timema genevievae TaxID=629358 RepID=A0A7R9K282_TIMGE|nr:unnamed protein product [Timema genevievae]